jgi:hypothetical protein
VKLTKVTPGDVATSVKLTKVTPGDVATSVKLTKVTPGRVATSLKLTKVTPDRVATSVKLTKVPTWWYDRLDDPIAKEGPAMPESDIPLADVIRELRRELLAAMKAGEGESLRFEVQDLEIEVQVVVTRGGEASAGGGVKFWVLNAESNVSAKYESSRIQKLTLKLRPKTDDGGKTVDLAG